MPKIYLSPAAHGTDNPCGFSKSCGENKHCNAYMDELEKYLKACGIEYKRASKANTGNNLKNSIAESNAYRPDLHYVCHTNAAKGKTQGSRAYVWPTGNGKKFAEIIMKHRRLVYPYDCAVKTNITWAEVRSTKAVVIYDEIVFHDNAADITFFHQNMRKMAEYTCRAFCEIFGVKFVDPYYVAPKPTTPTTPSKPVSPAPAPVPSPAQKPAPAVKSIDAIAREVIRGKYGVGAARKKNLIAAGYDPAVVQKRVNELLK